MSTERRAGRCQWHSSVSTTDFENLTYFSLYIVESEQTFSDSISDSTDFYCDLHLNNELHL